MFCATPVRIRRRISCLASICHTDASKLTVRCAADTRWTFQQIAGLPEVLGVIKQMSEGIISRQWGGKVTEQRRGVRKPDQPKQPGGTGKEEALTVTIDPYSVKYNLESSECKSHTAFLQKYVDRIVSFPFQLQL